MQCCIVGYSQTQIDKQLKEVLKEHHLESATLISFDGAQSDFIFDDFYYEAISESLFGEEKVVLLRNPLFLTTKKSLTETQQKQLIWLLKNPLSSISVLFTLESYALDKKKTVVKQLLKQVRMIELEELKERDVRKVLDQLNEKKQWQLDESTKEFILTYITELDDLMALSEKIDLLDHPVEVSLVRLLVTNEKEDVLFDLSNALVERKMHDVFKIYYQLKYQKVDPTAIIYILSSKLRQLAACLILQKQGYTHDQIAQTLKISSKFVWFLLTKQAQYYSLSQCLETLNELYLIDLESRLSRIDRNLAFELWLVKQGEKQWKV